LVAVSKVVVLSTSRLQLACPVSLLQTLVRSRKALAVLLPMSLIMKGVSREIIELQRGNLVDPQRYRKATRFHPLDRVKQPTPSHLRPSCRTRDRTYFPLETPNHKTRLGSISILLLPTPLHLGARLPSRHPAQVSALVLGLLRISHQATLSTLVASRIREGVRFSTSISLHLQKSLRTVHFNLGRHRHRQPPLVKL
jgi:hypothetical protein